MEIHWIVSEKIRTGRGERRWLRTYFFEKTPGISRLFYPWKFQTKQSSIPGNSAKLCYTHWKIQGQNRRRLGIPHYFFFSTPGNSMFLNPPVWIFYGIALWD